MKIEYFGHSCFKITFASGISVLTDPYTGVGYELPTGLRADFVTVSHGHFDHNFVDGLAYAGEVLQTVGEYTRKDVRFIALQSNHDEKGGTLRGKNLVFIVEADGKRLCHLGDVGESCTPSFVEKIGKVDVLFIPVGGKYTIDAREAKCYVDAIGAKTVVLMHYKPQDGTIDIATEAPFLSLVDGYAVFDGVYDTDEEERIVFMHRKEVV